jgi:transcription elongation GreA/GreB family factor
MKLTEVGKKQLELVIQENEKKLRELRQEKGQCGSVGHDDSGLEQIEAKELILIKLIKDDKRKLSTAILVDKTAENDDENKEKTVLIGKDIKISLTLESGEKAETVIEITEDFSPSVTKNKKKITLNAPLSECILGKQIGHIATYYVGNTPIIAEVLAIL